MRKLLKYILIFSTGLLPFLSCEDSKTYDGTLNVRVLTTKATFYVQDRADGYDTYTIPVQIVGGVSSKDITVNVVVNSSSTAVAGTDFELPSTVTIPAGSYEADLVIKGYFDGVVDESKELVFSITSEEYDIVPTYSTTTLKLQKFCSFEPTNFEGYWDVHDISDYDDEYDYQVYLELKGSNTTAMVDTFTVYNIWEYQSAVIYLTYADPSNFTVTIPKQKYFVHSTYGQGWIEQMTGGSFSSCDLTISTSYMVYVDAGYFDKVSSSEWTKVVTKKSQNFVEKQLPELVRK